jgi:GAF domain-containing protein
MPGEDVVMSEKSREARLNLAFVKLADTLTADYDVIDMLHTLVEECTSLLNVQAGGLVLADENGDLQVVASTSEAADFVEIMQLNSGTGPCVDCFTTGVAVSVADISKDGAKWPDFQTAMLEQGFASVHATPLRLRGQTLGSMSLFGTSVGQMSPEDAAVAQALSDVATIGILQERSIRETGIVAEQLQRALSSRVLIEQAKGVLSASGQMDVNQAFVALREYARRHNLTLRDVAENVADRSLNILSDAPTKISNN